MKIFSILSNSNMHEYYHLFSLSYLIEYGWIFLLILFIIEYFCYHLTYPSILSNISVTTYPLSYWIFISVTTCPLYFIISMSYYLLYYSIFLHISPYPLTFHITLPITYQNKQTIYIYIWNIQNYLPIILHPYHPLYLLYHILYQYLHTLTTYTKKHKKQTYYIPYYISITKNHTYIHIYISLLLYIYIIIYYHLYSLNTLIIPFIINFFIFTEIWI